jgi:hypothetical protein
LGLLGTSGCGLRARAAFGSCMAATAISAAANATVAVVVGRIFPSLDRLFLSS